MKKSDVFEIKALLWLCLSLIAKGWFSLFAVVAATILFVFALFLMWRDK